MKTKKVAFYVRKTKWTPEAPKEPTNLFERGWVANSIWLAALREWERTRKQRWYWEPIYEGTWGAKYQRTRWQSIGEYRVGTSYRKNPEHRPKERDENRERWRKSRKDWRHHNGWRRHCDCCGCVGWEVYNRGGDRARIRDAPATQ
jgi:hypothetical protein